MTKTNKFKKFFAVLFAGAFALIGAIFAVPRPQNITPKAETSEMTYIVQEMPVSALDYITKMEDGSSEIVAGKMARLYPSAAGYFVGFRVKYEPLKQYLPADIFSAANVYVGLEVEGMFITAQTFPLKIGFSFFALGAEFSGKYNDIALSDDFQYSYASTGWELNSFDYGTFVPNPVKNPSSYITLTLTDTSSKVRPTYYITSFSVTFSAGMGNTSLYKFVYFAGNMGDVIDSVRSSAASGSYADGFLDGQISGSNDGYEIGKAEGFEEGKKVGKEDGLKQGKELGYNTGYAEGVAAAGDYTFFGLISAVIDAPISAFSALFNFEILGMNMRSFVLSLLTAVVLVAVVRFFMGHVD